MENGIDISTSKVTREAVGLLLFGLYAVLKRGEKLGMTKFVQAAGLPITPIITALKDCKIVENTGPKGHGAEWRWIPAAAPNDLLIEKIFNHYAAQLTEYRKMVQRRNDARNGVERDKSGPAIKLPKGPADQTPSLFIRERLEALEDRCRYITDLLETLCKNLGVTETVGGHKIE